jgi:hypothetical protein
LTTPLLVTLIDTVARMAIVSPSNDDADAIVKSSFPKLVAALSTATEMLFDTPEVVDGDVHDDDDDDDDDRGDARNHRRGAIFITHTVGPPLETPSVKNPSHTSAYLSMCATSIADGTQKSMSYLSRKTSYQFIVVLHVCPMPPSLRSIVIKGKRKESDSRFMSKRKRLCPRASESLMSVHMSVHMSESLMSVHMSESLMSVHMSESLMSVHMSVHMSESLMSVHEGNRKKKKK